MNRHHKSLLCSMKSRANQQHANDPTDIWQWRYRAVVLSILVIAGASSFLLFSALLLDDGESDFAVCSALAQDIGGDVGGEHAERLCIGGVIVLIPRHAKGGHVLCHLFLCESYQPCSGGIVADHVGRLAHLAVVVPGSSQGIAAMERYLGKAGRYLGKAGTPTCTVVSAKTGVKTAA